MSAFYNQNNWVLSFSFSSSTTTAEVKRYGITSPISLAGPKPIVCQWPLLYYNFVSFYWLHKRLCQLSHKTSWSAFLSYKNDRSNLFVFKGMHPWFPLFFTLSYPIYSLKTQNRLNIRHSSSCTMFLYLILSMLF